jgi:predicted ATP-grasp superfamily ATP-dependent carboligase
MIKTSNPPAVVLGCGVNGLEVVRSLGRRGVPVTLIGQEAKDIANRSRYANAFRQAPEDPEDLLRTLLDLAARCPEPPVLIYTSDNHLKFVWLSYV